MCGINGFSFSDKNLIKRMNKSLNYRGPDGEGVYTDTEISLGQRRLSIIDLSSKGKQPMCNEDNSIWIVFNGEIYNFFGLRKELEAKGHKFKSDTDTEVLIHGYEEWGVNIFEKINGMWAFAIYDSTKKKIILSRDRLGKKPLYYSFIDNNLIFSSEIKGILQYKEIQKNINRHALDFFLSFSFIPEPMSIFSNIYKLQKSSYMIFDIRSKKKKICQYYKIPEKEKIENEKIIIDNGRKIIDEATKIRLFADVPIGCFLSGGLDSSAVTATMIKFAEKKEKIHTFSIGFEDEYDESKYAERVAEYLGTNHHHRYFSMKDFQKLSEKIYYYYDDPIAGSSIYPTYMVSKLARRFVKVSLSGDGGDELFGGYQQYNQFNIVQLLLKSPSFLRKIGVKSLSASNKLVRKKSLEKAKKGIEWSLSGRDNIPLIYFRGFRNEMLPKHVENFVKQHFINYKNMTEAVNRFDMDYVLTDRFLVKTDRASMAHGLEVRCPLLDISVVDFAQRIPIKYKNSLTKTKIVFRKIIEDRLPSDIVYREKKGFIAPVLKWLSEECNSWGASKLEELREMKIVSNDIINANLEYLKNRDPSRMNNVNTLISLSLWGKQWLN